MTQCAQLCYSVLSAVSTLSRTPSHTGSHTLSRVESGEAEEEEEEVDDDLDNASLNCLHGKVPPPSSQPTRKGLAPTPPPYWG